jgi:hypothetical protein
VVHDLIRKSGDIDVYVISGEDAPAQRTQRPMTRRVITQVQEAASKELEMLREQVLINKLGLS